MSVYEPRFVVLQREPDEWHVHDLWFDRVDVIRFEGNRFAICPVSGHLWRNYRPLALEGARAYVDTCLEFLPRRVRAALNGV